MFLRTVKASGGGGTQHEYLRLVESYREDGKSKQRVVCHLGRKDLLAAMDRGAIREKDYRWIPGVAGKTSGSRWGVLNALYELHLPVLLVKRLEI